MTFLGEIGLLKTEHLKNYAVEGFNKIFRNDKYGTAQEDHHIDWAYVRDTQNVLEQHSNKSANFEALLIYLKKSIGLYSGANYSHLYITSM